MDIILSTNCINLTFVCFYKRSGVTIEEINCLLKNPLKESQGMHIGDNHNSVCLFVCFGLRSFLFLYICIKPTDPDLSDTYACVYYIMIADSSQTRTFDCR